MNIEQLARKHFSNGYPVMAEQWLDFAEHIVEAQHRKTWALAMEHGDRVADKIWREHRSVYAKRAINAYRLAIREALPCPPIEVTKDK